MYIYICRHGETEWNQRSIYQGQLNSPLTEKGVKQAQELGTFFQDKGITRIYSSPLGRAYETTQILNLKVNCEVLIRDELMEMNFGRLQGLKSNEAEKRYQSFFQQRKKEKARTPFPGGESYFDLQARLLPLITELMKLENDIVIIGHESINRIVRGIILSMSVKDACKIRQSHREVVRISLKNQTSNTFFLS